MNKIFNFYNFINVISLVLNTYLVYLIIKTGIIPMRYLLIITGVIYILNIINIILSSRKNKIIKVIGYIFIFIYLIISSIGIYYLKTTNDFIDNSFGNAENYKEINYYVLTHKDSISDDFNDIKGSVLYYYSYEYNMDKVLKKLNKKTTFESKNYDDINLMFNDLKNNVISYVVVESSKYNSIIELSENIIKEDYKVIYQFQIKEEIKTEKSSNDDSFNIFIGGNDFTDNNIDFNMIMSINTKTHKVLLTSIPRDFYIEVYGYEGKKDNLSFIGNLGIDTSMKSIENLFGIKIDYYLKIKTTSLVELVDAVGGINYCSEHEYRTTHSMTLDSYNDNVGKKLYIKKGCQHLNGIETLTVARERLAFPGNDRQRQKNCQEIIIDIAEQLQSTNTILNYNNILNSINNLYETTLPKEVITNIIKDTVNDGAKWTFETQSVNGTDSKDYIHLSNLIGWVMVPDMNTVNEAKIKINQIIEEK